MSDGLLQSASFVMIKMREAPVRYRLHFHPSLRTVGDNDWRPRIEITLRLGRLPPHLSTIRMHPAQTPGQH